MWIDETDRIGYYFYLWVTVTLFWIPMLLALWLSYHSRKNPVNSEIIFKNVLRRGNVGWFLLILIAIPFSSAFFIYWLSHIKTFTTLNNYLIAISLIIVTSLSFSLLNFLIHLIDNGSHILLPDISKKEILTRKEISLLEEKEIKDEIKLYESLYLKLKNFNEVIFLGFSSFVDVSNIKPSFNYWLNGHPVYVFKVADLEIYYLLERNSAGGDNIPSFYNNHIFINGIFYNIDPLLNEETSFPFTLTDFNSPNIKSNTVMQYLKEKIKQQIEYKKNTELISEKSYSKSNVIPLSIFVYSNLFMIVGLNQNYITPTSSSAKIAHFIFGLYRLILLGGFISVLLRNF